MHEAHNILPSHSRLLVQNFSFQLALELSMTLHTGSSMVVTVNHNQMARSIDKVPPWQALAWQ